MHLFIDVRSTNPGNTIVRRYAESWIQLWKKYHTSDTFSFLIYAEQGKSGEQDIIIPKSSWIPWKKPISKHTTKIFRSVNFSGFPPYDGSIPTISHIFDNCSWLYPETNSMSYLSRKDRENGRKLTFEKSISTIVPNMSTGSELVELWHAKEEKIEIIPYIPFFPITEDVGIFSQFGIKKPYFLYDGTFGHEANIAGLFKGFETYRNTLDGTHQLILHGFAGEELSHITQLIRTFDIHDSVKFIGQLTESGRESLYKNASGWIYIGGYYGGGPMIELAQNHALPLLLSDIQVFNEYPGLRIHPNHIDKIAKMLKDLETYIPPERDTHHEQAFVKVYEKILSRSM